MSEDIRKYPLKSGEIIGEDGETKNIVTLLGGGDPVSEEVHDIRRYPPRSGRVIGEDGKLYNLVDLLQEIAAGEGKIEDGSVTTQKLADGAITTEKLAQDVLDLINEHLKKSGGTATGPIVFADPNNRSKLILTKYPDGTGHNNAPTTLDLGSVYLHLGGTEYAQNSYRLIGFGYRRHGDQNHASVVAGSQEINTTDHDMGDFIVGTRNSTSDVAPTIIFRVTHDGQIQAENPSYLPTSDKSLVTRKNVSDLIAAKLAEIEPIEDPSSTTAEDLAIAYNALLSALKG